MRGIIKLAKHRSIRCCFLILGLFFFAMNVHAASDSTHSIDINVQLMDNGSAQITQVWNTSRASGTEGYIVHTNLDDIEIIDFSVTDETGTVYQNIGKWDVNGSLEDKANKCGINTSSDGLELCWGIGSYGVHTYTLTYTMTNFIKHFADDTFGFYSRFVNDDLSDPPGEIQVTIQRPNIILSAENAGIWGFGYSGEIEFIDGSVIARNTQTLTKGNHVTILMRLDAEIVSGSASSSLTFEEVEAMAKMGSDYEDSRSGEMPQDVVSLLLYNLNPQTILVGLGLIAFIFINIIKSLRSKKGKRIKPKELEYYRDIPLNGDLPSCYYVLDYYDNLAKESDLISAYLLRWIKQGYIVIDTRESKDTLGSGERMETSLIFKMKALTENPVENVLFKIMILAAGDDHILQKKELKKWILENYSELSYWFYAAKRAGQTQFINNGWAAPRGRTSSYGADINEQGFLQGQNVFGFKKYLKDFTLVNEREAKEVHLWDDYLIFAALFGCADAVVKQFRILNPRYIQSSAYTKNNMDLSETYDFVDSISRTSSSAMHSAKSKAKSSDDDRNSGGGGSSSSGGGTSGYSGGGSGGGFR